jgi:hypothetical protein
MPSPKGQYWTADPTRPNFILRREYLWCYPDFEVAKFSQLGDVTMTDQNQTQKHTSGLTDRGVREEDFNFEDFWRHQLHRIKEIAEDEQSPKEGGDRNFMESKISSKLLRSFVVLEIRTGFTG